MRNLMNVAKRSLAAASGIVFLSNHNKKNIAFTSKHTGDTDSNAALANQFYNEDPSINITMITHGPVAKKRLSINPMWKLEETDDNFNSTQFISLLKNNGIERVVLGMPSDLSDFPLRCIPELYSNDIEAVLLVNYLFYDQEHTVFEALRNKPELFIDNNVTIVLPTKTCQTKILEYSPQLKDNIIIIPHHLFKKHDYMSYQRQSILQQSGIDSSDHTLFINGGKDAEKNKSIINSFYARLIWEKYIAFNAIIGLHPGMPDCPDHISDLIDELKKYDFMMKFLCYTAEEFSIENNDYMSDTLHSCQLNVPKKIADKMSDKNKLNSDSVLHINEDGNTIAACSDGVITYDAGTIAAVNAEKKHPVFIKNKKEAESLLVDKTYVYTDMQKFFSGVKYSKITDDSNQSAPILKN